MTPFRNPEERSLQSTYNTQHAKGRNIVERTIGVLKNRFRCLLRARALHYTPEKCTQIINVCVALYNICVFYNVQYSEDIFNEPHEETDESNIETIENDSVNNLEAEEIRNGLLATL